MTAEIDAFLRELEGESRAVIEGLLRRAYERGFREGLSAAGVHATEAAPATERTPPLAEPAPSTTPSAPPTPPPESAALAWEEAGPDDEEGPFERDEPRPIMVHATVGTLMRRIVRTFALDRFDIDVIVCRRGDRDRRQLKSSVRLRNYLRER